MPIAGWRECVTQALSVAEIRDWSADLIDGDDPLLLEQIQARLLARRGVWAAPEEILVTVGAQQALYLLATLLVGAETTVGVEDPGYPDARNIFASRSAHVVRAAARRRGPGAVAVAGRLRARLSDAVVPVPDQRHDAARAAAGVARLGRHARSRADRGRLRDRDGHGEPRAAGAEEPRCRRTRRLRREPVEDARPRHPAGVHRRQPRADRRGARAAPPDAAPSRREQRALGRPVPGDGLSRRAAAAHPPDLCRACGCRRRGACRAPAGGPLSGNQRRVVVLAALPRRDRHAGAGAGCRAPRRADRAWRRLLRRRRLRHGITRGWDSRRSPPNASGPAYASSPGRLRTSRRRRAAASRARGVDPRHRGANPFGRRLALAPAIALRCGIRRPGPQEIRRCASACPRKSRCWRTASA